MMAIKVLFRLAKDQTEINKVIAEVSKGSKFYEVCIRPIMFLGCGLI